MKSITYSIDALVPGFYLWARPFYFQLGGADAPQEYSGIIHSFIGIALVFPGLQLYTTYRGTFDPL
jgi:hypothetical protein